MDVFAPKLPVAHLLSNVYLTIDIVQDHQPTPNGTVHSIFADNDLAFDSFLRALIYH